MDPKKDAGEWRLNSASLHSVAVSAGDPIRRIGWGFGSLILLLLGAACGPDLDTDRVIPKRGTAGQEIYGVLCDRIGAQALHEDLTGASFAGICHGTNGAYTMTVDQALLPPVDGDGVDEKGNSVSEANEEQTRTTSVARVEALARRRDDLIAALDATFPDVQVPVKDIENADTKKSCNPAAGTGTNDLPNELVKILGRFQDLYVDGTIPQASEGLARVVDAFGTATDAQDAWTRTSARKGYSPLKVALGAIRPVLAYPGLRDLANATLSIVSAEADPYASGMPTAGSAYPQFSKFLEVEHGELASKVADAALAPLTTSMDATLGRAIISRPRSNLELARSVLFAADPVFGGGAAQYIVKRDTRGYAALLPTTSGTIPAPFVDANGDGLPDVDTMGRFVTAGGTAPTPFFTVGETQQTRDTFTRAVDAKGALLYDYLDTSRTFASSVLTNVKPFVNPSPTDNHETLMDAFAAAEVLFGSRDGSAVSTQSYSSGAVQYNAFHPADAAALDLLHAGGNVLAEPTTDDLFSLAQTLLVGHEADLARFVAAALDARARAANHPEAQIPDTSTFWDEILDVVVQIEKEPGLLEDMLTALKDPATQKLATGLASFTQFKDDISYDRSNLNGAAFNLTTSSGDAMRTPVDRTQPDTGANRSGLQRFLSLVHDGMGLTVCNKDGAILHGQVLGLPADLPLLGPPYKECEVFVLPDVSKFYVDAVVGKAELIFRPDILKTGFLGIGQATVDLIQQSSGIDGFYEADVTDTTFHPRPTFLNRLVFFDLANDSPNTGDANFLTNHFIADLNGPDLGTSVCPERVIADPDPTAVDAAADGMVHGLRSCGDGDSLFQRDKDASFIGEDFAFFDSAKPLFSAFVDHEREDLLVELLDTLHRHYADGKGTDSECKLSSDPSNPHQTCSKDGIVTYEPLLGEILAGDIVPATANLLTLLDGVSVTHCDSYDAKTHACTASHSVGGTDVLLASVRALVDPDHAKSEGLTDRAGAVTAKRNDGTTNPQVTPVYLLANALHEADLAFDAFAKANPMDAKRQDAWHAARSQITDQFFAVGGSGSSAAFTNRATVKIAPVLLDVLRAQLLAHCPQSLSAPFPRCTWATTDLTNSASDTVGGPLFASSVDLADGIRQNDAARAGLEQLLTYLLDAASTNDALATTLTTIDDLVQILQDDTNIVPLMHFLSSAVNAPNMDKSGNVTQKSVIDATSALLARISGRAIASDGTENCKMELDPNQVMAIAIANAVTPIPDANGNPGDSPLEVFERVIDDLNRVDPSQTTDLASPDYASIGANVSDFLENKESGLEQLYAVMRNGVPHE